MKYLKIVYHTLKLLIAPQKHIESLIFIGDQVSMSRSARHSAYSLYQQQEFKDLYQNRSRIKSIDTTKLEKCSIGTLGYKMKQFYNQDEIILYPNKSLEHLSRTEFITEMIRRNHDYLHVLFDFSTDLEGEAQANIFTAIQTRMPLSLIIVAGILLRTAFYSPRRLPTLFDKIIKAATYAKQYENFLLTEWNNHLDKPISQIKSKLRLARLAEAELGNYQVTKHSPLYQQVKWSMDLRNLRPELLQ